MNFLPAVLPRLASAADALEPIAKWWREAKMWTLMYRGGLLASVLGVAAFVLWRVLAARHERVRLEALVASRTRQLRQGEELFRSIFEHATVGIFQSSLDGHNLRANPAMARLCGYDSPQQMQQELTDVATGFYVQPGRREEINAAVARDGAAVDYASEIRRRDGTTVWVAESVRTVVDPASGQSVYQGSIVDITARREMQRAQEQARVAAETANAARGAFLTHMTHELRTPLTGILSNARVALRDPALDEKNRARYGLVVCSGEHLLSLIDEVLDLSRIEAGHMEIHAAPFRLDELLRTVTDAFRPRAVEGQLEFRAVAEPALPKTVHGDSLRLRQVLDNLLGNAFKFTGRGGVDLGVGRGDTARTVRFEVSDTGIGIPNDQFAVIFEPFRQVAQPGHAPRPGAGLGLHISARLVELMGGRLRVESVPDQGSRFFFDLPLPDAGGGETLHDAGKKTAPSPAASESPPSPVSPRSPVSPNPPVLSALPAAADLDALLTLSLEGDIVRLRSRLRELAAADADLAAFTREVDSLAAGFRMDAIGDFLVRARQMRPDEPPAAVPEEPAS